MILAKTWEPAQTNPQEYQDNDAGRAAHFVDSHISAIRFVPQWQSWLLWEGHRWRRDDLNSIMTLAVEHHRRVQSQIIDCISDPKERARELSRTLKHGDAKRLRDMLTVASADKRIVVSQERLDANKNLLGLKNGVWDFTEGVLRPGSPEDMITKQVNAEYSPDAVCPLWDSHIAFAAQGDPRFSDFLQTAAGYSFTGHTSEEVWFFHYGGGFNGKSVYCDSLLVLAGDYGHKAQSRLYMEDKWGKAPEDEQAALAGKRFVLGPEVDEGQKLAEGRIKEIVTANGWLVGRWQHGRRFDIELQCKLWLYGNYQPVIWGTDRGTWRRLRLVPWTAEIPEHLRQKDFKDRIYSEEMPGVLKWILAGASRWMQAGDLATPSCVSLASESYRKQEDVLADFFDEQVAFDPAAWVAWTALYQHYAEWAARLKIKPLSRTMFQKRVRQLPNVQEGKQAAVRGWRGIMVRE